MEGKRLAIDSSIWLYQVSSFRPSSFVLSDHTSFKLLCEIKMGGFWSTHMC